MPLKRFFCSTIQSHVIRLKVHTFLPIVIELLQNVIFTQESLRKICQNTGLFLPLFSRIKTEFTTQLAFFPVCHAKRDHTRKHQL